MRSLNTDADVQIASSSGIFRVVVRPSPNLGGMFIQIVFFGAFLYFAIPAWDKASLWLQVLLVFLVLSSIVGFVYQFSGSETIEFDEQKLSIRKETLGWRRHREYRMQDCSGLEVLDDDSEDNSRFTCSVGWHSIRFGEYLTEDQAISIISDLQRSFPAIADRLLGSGGTQPHFTTLNLDGHTS